MTKRRTETPDATEFAQLRAHITDRLGFHPSEVSGAVGSQPHGRSRAQVAADVAAWLRDRPKG